MNGVLCDDKPKTYFPGYMTKLKVATTWKQKKRWGALSTLGKTADLFRMSVKFINLFKQQ